MYRGAATLFGSAGREGIYGISIQSGEDHHLFQGETFYGGFVEFGTIHQAAQGFMQAARDENMVETPRIFRREVKRYVQEVQATA